MKKTRRSYNSTLPAGKPLKRKGKSRFPKRRCKLFTEWIKGFPCSVVARRGAVYGEHCNLGPVDPAHVCGTRNTGAYDVGEVVPLCRLHHQEQEGRTTRFNAKYGLNLQSLAREWGRRWREQQGETAA